MRAYPPRGNDHWNNLSERRLDDLNGQLREVRADLVKLWEELRKDIRAGDNRMNLIERLDERMADMSRRVEEWRTETRAADEAMKKSFVTSTEFEPVKKAVFGVIAAACLAMVAAVARLVMK